MPLLIILRGPAGIGKSTIASQLKEKIRNAVHLDIDSFKHIISLKSSSERSKIAHNVGTTFTKELLENNFNVIAEEIFRADYYNEVKLLADGLKCERLTVFLTAPLEVLIKRDQERKYKTKGAEVITSLYNEIKYIDEDLNIDAVKNNTDEVITQILAKVPNEYQI